MTSKVQVTAHHAIHCADPTAVATLESPFRLGPIDALVIPFVPIKNVFVYQKPASTAKDSFIPIERLRSAVTYLLDYYPHLIGRLGFNLGTGAAEVDRLGNGAELQEAY
ncbi:hypothetical protein SI65_02376 [Aspergillus cristatus]|uniref:Uncharacterized protein n=1 Tax=Aspergillus cristatus TaxID=573508 RepID=A0A1E3BKM1_ASPCR|nr:hypothetical protein SI65_02376 [Aspergillus cristatus]